MDGKNQDPFERPGSFGTILGIAAFFALIGFFLAIGRGVIPVPTIWEMFLWIGIGVIGLWMLSWVGMASRAALFLSVLLSIPAHILSMPGLMLYPLCRFFVYVFYLAGRAMLPVFDGFIALLRLFTANPVIHGNLEEIWRLNRIDADHRPELHRTDIPADARQPLWRNGMTVIGHCCRKAA